METVAVTPEVLDLLSQRRVFHAARSGRRWKVGDKLLVTPTARLEPYSNILQGDALPLAIGAFSYSHSPFRSFIEVGRYCSIGTGVAWMGGPHPMDWASTSSAFYDSGTLQGVSVYFRDQGQTPAPQVLDQRLPLVRIGHDVWIGDGAMIAPGVSIGHGAVIGARALVLKDVPPYAVAYGHPAEVRRLRFPEATVERLLRSEWWRYTPDVLQRLPVREPDRFVTVLEELIAAETPRPMNPIPLTGAELIASGAISHPLTRTG